MAACSNCWTIFPSSDAYSPCRACTRSQSYLCTSCLEADWKAKIEDSSTVDDSEWTITCGRRAHPVFSRRCNVPISLDDMASYYTRASKAHKSIYRKYFFECQICCETKTIKNSRRRKEITNACRHEPRMCLYCTSEVIRGQFDLKLSTVISCPEKPCPGSLEWKDMKTFAPSDVFARYDYLVISQAVEKMPDFRWCANQKCANGYLHIGGKERPMMTCPDCQTVMCFNHSVRWHNGQSCDQFQKVLEQRADVASEVFVERTTKQCPSCTASISKDGGCDHMICSRCNHEFCWLCLVDWEKAMRRTLRHAANCKYHR
ncbi:hypothetical protein CPB86DRAFT_787878 [Serendipita vermifera]|nr:hypothetical protein CPB86DRAFT_787878 [Serendipita vermifera]